MSSAKSIENTIRQLINDVGFTLPPQNVADANDLLDHREWGEALDLICTQLFEYDVKVTSGVYYRIKSVGEIMKMPQATWEILKELVRPDN